MSTFRGVLLVTDREVLLTQSTAGGMSVQTPILMDTDPPSASGLQQQMDWARSFFVNDQGLQTGAKVTIQGVATTVRNIPVILMTEP
jgi:hypothetical protein